MVGIYLSGSGNTKHCVEKLVKLLEQAAQYISLKIIKYRKKVRNVLEKIGKKN